MLEDLVVCGALLLVFSEHSVHAINCSVRHKFFELLSSSKQEVTNVGVENNIKSRDQVALCILVMAVLGHRVGQLPGVAALSVLGHILPLRLLDVFMHANIDEGLLVKVLLVDVTHQLLSSCLYAECGNWLYQLGPHWKITSSFQLSQIGLVFSLILWVRDLLYVVIKDRFELLLLHCPIDGVQLGPTHVHLFTLKKWMIDLMMSSWVIGVLGWCLGFWISFNCKAIS